MGSKLDIFGQTITIQRMRPQEKEEFLVGACPNSPAGRLQYLVLFWDSVTGPVISGGPQSPVGSGPQLALGTESPVGVQSPASAGD